MTENKEKLRSTLEELRNELKSIEQLDDATRELLENTAEQLNDALHQDSQEMLEHPSLTENLSKATDDFEESHPALTRIIGNIVDILGNSGL
ncbi:MAG: hypothetical protein COA78_34905 [Blastopirellula sp.]|nr:MAG: hypothetical protein COA78_34905 [Blastopirellula sp.]